ncbi:MAG: AzlD domain-containing protein [Pseudomonadales bacterium]|jgi:branched-subunit amino acid transport protein|nr:AzlD domain-containing protein [Pseudomonadales bacterium]MBL6808594.1 AzlD domain-containing protein [Pseudomonadales bacterium]
MSEVSKEALWLTIAALGVGTYLIRFSFLGFLGGRTLPSGLLRLLRYVPVSVFPALVAPQVLWPPGTGGAFDGPRFMAALATLAVGLWRRNVLLALGAGLGVLFLLEGLRRL